MSLEITGESHEKLAESPIRERRQLTEEERTLPAIDLQKKYGFSRATAFRAKKSGWFVPEYRDRYDNINVGVAEQLQTEILESAKRGARVAIRLLLRTVGTTDNIESFLAPMGEDDVIMEAALRLLQLTGEPDIHNEHWRREVAKRNALSFIRVNSIGYRKRHVPTDFQDPENEELSRSS